MNVFIKGGVDITAKKKTNLFLLLFFYPVYFTSTGIYKVLPGQYIEHEGLVLPFTVILGFYSLLSILKIKTNQNKIKYDNDTRLLLYIIIFYYLIFMYTFTGLSIFNVLSSLILTMQFTSGILGVIIAFYLVNYRDMTARNIFYGLSIVFLIAIILNISLSLYRVGFNSTFSRNIYAATPLGGIHHIFVYYPFIVGTIFNFALPFWENKKMMIPVYLLVLIYLLSIQVKGAILSYLLGFIVYFLFFIDGKKLTKKISLLMVFLATIVLLPKEFILGRFMMKNTSLISGREEVWRLYFESLKINPVNIFRGSFVKSTGIVGGMSNTIGSSSHSYHNQYLEILDSYGLFLFLFFIFILLSFLIKLSKKIKLVDGKKSKAYKYWMCLILIHLTIDLNTNVPLRVTNPAIILFFYWTTVFLLLKKEEIYNNVLITESKDKVSG